MTDDDDIDGLAAEYVLGTLRGRAFLCQRELLRPFFGADLTPLHELRDVVRGLLPQLPVLRPREAVTDDAS